MPRLLSYALGTCLALSGHTAAVRLQQRSTSREHPDPDCRDPEWLQDCRLLFLDLGSNNGVTVRKFYEAQKYPKAGFLPLYEQYFGSAEYRRRPANETGICALGFEPHPMHRDRLDEIEKAYQARGWHAHFYHCAVSNFDGIAHFDVSPKWFDKHLDRIAHISFDSLPVDVPAMDFPEWAKRLPGQSKVGLLKIDIEGAEWNILGEMLKDNKLCANKVHAANIETHPQGDVSAWEGERKPEVLKATWAKQACGKNNATRLTEYDDEDYAKDVDTDFGNDTVEEDDK